MNILLPKIYICYIQTHVAQIFKPCVFLNSLNTMKVFILFTCLFYSVHAKFTLGFFSDVGTGGNTCDQIWNLLSRNLQSSDKDGHLINCNKMM